VTLLERSMKLIISLVYHAFQKGGAVMRALLGKRRPGRFIVLTYHAVKAGDRRRFASQMDALKKCGVAEFADASRPSADGVRIAVTFDDGFASVAENALPEMAERGIPATIFVTTGYLGERAGWIHKKSHPNYHEKILSLRQLKDIRGELVRIGSHSAYHPDLSRVGHEEMVAELRRSKASLETIFERPVRMLSLPYGGCSREILDAAKLEGYERIFLNVPLDGKYGDEGHIIGRTNVTPDDWALEFTLKASGAYQWLPVAMRVKKRLRSIWNGYAGLRPRSD